MLAPATSSQTIEITSIPAYGAQGPVQGRVTGVPFASHRVAIYILVEGRGWWTKPSSVNPTVPIQADGTFSANFFWSNLDPFSTLVHAVLLGPGVNPPIIQGNGTPAAANGLAIATAERYARILDFAGRRWGVKYSPQTAGPGDNLFSRSPNDVFVDAHGNLHLRVVRQGGVWYSTEVILLETLGYGTYWFTTESQVGQLDPNVTFGAFTWDSFGDDDTIPAWPYREIDFEDSRWGNALDPTSSQAVVQPYFVTGNTRRFTTPTLFPAPTLSRFFTWTRDAIRFVAATGLRTPGAVPPSTVLHESTYVHDPARNRRVPPAGRERFRFNLWINGGGRTSNGASAEVVISDFRFSSVPGAIVGGCGVNPTGSTTIDGSASVGGTLVIGVDNPLGTQANGSVAAVLFAGRANPGFPCGARTPGWGMDGGDGELAIPLFPPPPAFASAIPWIAPGRPVPVFLPIPMSSALIGSVVYAQGAIVDPAAGGGSGPFIGLADPVEVVIQP